MKQGSKESEVGETVEKGQDKIRAWWQREALPGVSPLEDGIIFAKY
jgi:hypothetical protein